MASSGLTIVFPVQSIYDIESGTKAMSDMQNALSKAKPLQVKWDIGAERGTSMVDKLGGGGAFQKMIDGAATGAGKLSVAYTNIYNSQTKLVESIPTEEFQTFKGVMGEVAEENVKYNKRVEELNQKLESGKYQIVGYSKSTKDFEKSQKLVNDVLTKAQSEVDRYGQAAAKTEMKLKNMGGSQAKSAKEATTALQAEIKEFNRLQQSGNVTAGQLQKVREAAERMNVAFEGTKTGANVFQNFANRIGNAVQQTIAYSFSIGLVYKAQQLLNDAVKYAIDLNTEMTKIQVLQAEGAKTPEEINALAQSFNDLGQEMGASTLEIAKGSVEWFRQGRTVEETQKLMKASMMLSKLGAMESADATNYLTSITNAFKIEVNDTAEVVDKLIAVDNIAATSAGELATALRYTSETAALAGVSLEQLVSYIGTVSTVTRQNAEMIGQAFKTMFSRMTLIQGGGTDEEGWTISKVEKALSAVNIEMKNADGTFRNMGDVLEDTAKKWDTLGEREQIEIAVAIGGVRQKEAFLVLMDNMDKALTYQAAQYDANGLAMDRYGIYLESIQAKQGKLTASMQEFYASVVNSGMISAFYDMAIGIVQAITQGHLLIPILGTILFLIVEINREAIKGKVGSWINVLTSDFGKLKDFLLFFRVGFSSATQASKLAGQSFSLLTKTSWGLSTALKSVGISAGAGTLASILSVAGPIILAIGAITIAYKAYKKGIEETKKAQEEALKAMNDYANAVEEQSDTFKNAQSVSKTLKNLFAIPEAERTEDDLEKINQSFKELYDIMPYLKEWKFANGDPYLEEASFDAAKLNDELEKTTQLTQEEADQIYSAARESIIQYHKLGLEIEALEAKKQAYSVLSQAAYNDEIKTAQDARTKLTEELNKMNLPPAWRKKIWNEISGVIEDESSWGKLDKDFGDSLKNMADTAGEQLGDSEETKTILENSLKKLLSRVMADLTPEGQGLLAKLFGLDPAFFEDTKNKIEEDAKKLKNIARIDRAETDFSKDEEKRLQNIKDTNDLYEKQLSQIDLIASGIQNLKDISEDSTKSQLDFDTAVSKFVNEINKADIQGLSVTLDDFKNKATGAFDIELIKNWGKEHLNNAYIMNKLKDLDIDLYNSIVNGSNAASAAINGITYSLATTAGYFQVTKENAGQAMDWLAQSAFNTATEMGTAVQITANTGEVVVVTSLNDILTLVNNGLITENEAMTQLINFLVKYAVDAKNVIGTVFSDLSKGFPIPKPISYPSGGGGGGGAKKEEDPRIKELDRLIELEEDEIEKLEDQIELYNRQKEAIDRVIEAEEWKKELIDRQIAIYEEQIEDIDRQIELYERVKDGIDEVIDDYEKQKDAIDDLIDLQEKLKEPLEAQKDALDERLDSFNEYIDLQKESLERMKDEEDFVEELEKKHKKLSATKAELALATLDNSEEGIKRRLELEQQLAEDEEDLTEFTEERKYELQIRALDDAQKAFEKNIEAQIKLIDDQIKLIDDQIKKYEEEKGAIDDLIAPLEKQKEAIDNIIKPLENQKIALEDLIYPLEEQKEAIDLVIQGYDDEKRAIDALIQPIQDTIQAMRDRIEVWQEEKEAIQEVIDALGGGGGGGSGGLGQAYDDMAARAEEALSIIIGRSQDLIEKTGLVESSIQGLINKYNEAGISAETLASRVEAAMLRIAAAMGTGGSVYGPGGTPGGPTGGTVPVPGGPGSTIAPAPPQPGQRPQVHEGGFASAHGPDVFEGTLKDSEVFAKLLKGEYVSTEDQMRNFLRKTLPSIATEAARMLSDERDALRDRARANGGGEPKRSIPAEPRSPNMSIQPIIINGPPTRPASELVRPIGDGGGKAYENAYRDMNFEMNINVNGSLDKSVLPDLKKAVIKEINKSLEKRGIRRTADNFAI
jgi:TP901 family phage tail tape measure protein